MKKNPKIIFMGTPEFAAAILEKLFESHFHVIAVFTQPDKKMGRHQELGLSPVKRLALKHNVKVFQPETLRASDVAQQFAQMKPDLIVVAAYGKILTRDILEVPQFGAINVHTSLLPKYRGASPIQSAILAGDKHTGVTLMRMDEGMDTGDILAQKKITIAEKDTAATLEERLAKMGASLLAEKIPAWVSGKIKPLAQDGKSATYCKTIEKADARINWSDSSEFILRKSRAYSPWPGIFTHFKGKRLKLTEICSDSAKGIREKPGKVVEYNQCIAIATAKGAVILKKVQFEGKKEMAVEEFSRGREDFLGSILS